MSEIINDSKIQKVTEVYLDPIEVEDFAKTFQSIIFGYSVLDHVIDEGSYFDLNTGEFCSNRLMLTRIIDFYNNDYVRFYVGKAPNYQPNTFVLEDIQTECPKAFYNNSDGSKKELKVIVEETDLPFGYGNYNNRITLYLGDLEEFVKSIRTKVCASMYRYEFDCKLLISSICKDQDRLSLIKPNIGMFYKQKASEYPPNTYVVENVQTESFLKVGRGLDSRVENVGIKAFYIYPNGTKRELEVNFLEYFGHFD